MHADRDGSALGLSSPHVRQLREVPADKLMAAPSEPPAHAHRWEAPAAALRPCRHTRQAFRWSARGGMVGLGILPGMSWSSAKAVSASVIGQNRPMVITSKPANGGR